jgi:hypothetical protein
MRGYELPAMNLGRMASISRVFLEEGLGFLVSDGEGDPPPEAELAVRLRRAL